MNSFVYVVDLLESPLSAQPPPVCAVGTFERPVSVLPATITKIVVKIPNDATLLNEASRVQNEVAAIEIFRDALAEAGLARIVPTVYGWQATEWQSEHGSVNGWIALEHMSGTSLEDELPTFSLEAKRNILGEIAIILKIIQSYRLPPSIIGYGGLKFDPSGKIVTGPTTLPCGGPFRSLTEMHKQMLRKQLETSDDPKADIIGGWRQNSHMLREHLEHFEANGNTTC